MADSKSICKPPRYKSARVPRLPPAGMATEQQVLAANPGTTKYILRKMRDDGRVPWDRRTGLYYLIAIDAVRYL